MNHTAFMAPAAYVQGAGVLDDAAEHFERLTGERAYVLGGETSLSVAGDRVGRGLRAAGIEPVETQRGVERCTRERIETLAERVEGVGADLVVGVGGGVAVDVATAAADATGAELAAVPTIAATDAPTSTVGVVYDDAGNYEDIVTRERNPELVLVDTAAIAAAPARFLAHGMGDALATTFEAEAVARAGTETVAGGKASPAALELARACLPRVREYGADALAAVERDAVTPAVERIVETNTLLSGLGFESGGTAGAHAVQIGLTNAGAREPHGELVAFGTVAQLVLEGRTEPAPRELVELLDELGLANTLDDFGVTDVGRVAEVACEEGMDDMPVDVSERAAADAVRTADALLDGR